MSEFVNLHKKRIYIKDKPNYDVMKKVSYVFLFSYFVLPQYFGIPTPVFDFTAQRILVVIFFVMLMSDRNRIVSFYDMVRGNVVIKLFIPFFIIAVYTGILRGHIGTFMYPMIEILAMCEVLYIMKYIISIDDVIIFLKKCLVLLCILGIVEFVMQNTPFSYIETIKGLYTGGMIRSGSYRIMGPANHSLGYGLMLITSMPFVCVDLNNKRIDIFQNRILFLLVTINVFLTGSRSTLAIYALEIGLMILFSDTFSRKRAMFIICIIVTILALLVFGTYGSSFSNYIMLQITSIIDSVFDTELAVNFGADAYTLECSAAYREILPQIFTLEWVNPWLGRGSGVAFSWYTEDGLTISSIDNYYVATYLRYAYPGLIANLIFILGALISMIKNVKKSYLNIVMLISSVCYFVNLWWLDTLQTIKYVYILFAISMVVNELSKEDEITE